MKSRNKNEALSQTGCLLKIPLQIAHHALLSQLALPI